jgi:hypothetical protein
MAEAHPGYSLKVADTPERRGFSTMRAFTHAQGTLGAAYETNLGSAFSERVPSLEVCAVVRVL